MRSDDGRRVLACAAAALCALVACGRASAASFGQTTVDAVAERSAVVAHVRVTRGAVIDDRVEFDLQPMTVFKGPAGPLHHVHGRYIVGAEYVVFLQGSAADGWIPTGAADGRPTLVLEIASRLLPGTADLADCVELSTAHVAVPDGVAAMPKPAAEGTMWQPVVVKVADLEGYLRSRLGARSGTGEKP